MQKLLSQNKYFFLPVLNVDGVSFIEDNWKKTKKIVRKRKNDDKGFGNCNDEATAGEDVGVDLNRNFAIDFKTVEDMDGLQYNQIHDPSRAQMLQNQMADPCEYNFPGFEPFSEPESQAYRDFVLKNQKDLSFVINMHSNGNAFIYPFNGRADNDIE